MLDPPQRSHGDGADDRRHGELLAVGELDRAGRADVDAANGRPAAHAAGEPVGERRREAAAAVREPETLPGPVVAHRTPHGRCRPQLCQHREPLDRPGGGREGVELGQPICAAGRVAAPQEVAQREPVEPLCVRMRPGVRRVDLCGEAVELRRDAPRALPVVLVQPGLAEHDAVDEVVGRLAGLVDVARHELEVELGRQAEVVAVQLACQLAAELDDASVRESLLLDPSAHAVARLDDEHVRSRPGEVVRAGEPGQPGAHDDDVVAGHRPSGAPGSERISFAARTPLRSAPSISPCHSPAVCSPANASAPTRRASASSSSGDESERAE